MSKLTKKPNKPVLTRLTKALVAGTVLVAGCGDEPIGVPSMDAGPADVMENTDVGPDAPTIGVPPAGDAGPDAPAIGVPPADDAGPDVGADAPAIGVPPAGDAG